MSVPIVRFEKCSGGATRCSRSWSLHRNVFVNQERPGAGIRGTGDQGQRGGGIGPEGTHGP
eukprot:6912339-Pyramimonas_sp.AAC.1